MWFMVSSILAGLCVVHSADSILAVRMLQIKATGVGGFTMSEEGLLTTRDVCGWAPPAVIFS
jgi:hypothetical protein